MTAFRRLLCLSLATMSFPVLGQNEPQSFCQRLAPQLGMKLVPLAPNSTQRIWKTDIANFGMYLFGGTATLRFTASPLDTTNAAEFVRLSHACDDLPKGVLCHVDGPAKVEISTRRFKAAVEMSVAERADVQVRNSVVTCRDRP